LYNLCNLPIRSTSRVQSKMINIKPSNVIKASSTQIDQIGPSITSDFQYQSVVRVPIQTGVSFKGFSEPFSLQTAITGSNDLPVFRHSQIDIAAEHSIAQIVFHQTAMTIALIMVGIRRDNPIVQRLISKPPGHISFTRAKCIYRISCFRNKGMLNIKNAVKLYNKKMHQNKPTLKLLFPLLTPQFDFVSHFTKTDSHSRFKVWKRLIIITAPIVSLPKCKQPVGGT